MSFLVRRLQEAAKEAKAEAERATGLKRVRLSRLSEILEAEAHSLPREVEHGN